MTVLHRLAALCAVVLLGAVTARAEPPAAAAPGSADQRVDTVSSAPPAPQSAPPRPGVPTGPQALTVSDYSDLPFLSDARLSPDGTRIAARINSHGSDQIGVWTLSAPRDQPPVMIDASGLESFAWAGDQRLIFTSLNIRILASNSMIGIGQGREVFCHDLVEKKTTPVSQSRGLFADVIFIDPLGRYALVSSQASMTATPNVLRVDLATGQSVEVQPRRSGVWSWFADSNGYVRVGVDYGDNRARIYYRPTPDAPLAHTDTRRDLLNGSVVDTVRFVTNTDHGVIVTNAANGRFGVYDYDFATDTRGAAIFEHPEVDTTAAIFSPEGSVDGVTYEDDRPRVRWLNPALADLQRAIDRTFPGKTNMIINRSRDGNRVLIFSTAADDPGTYYVYDRAGRRMETFASPYDRLQGHDFAQMRPVTYQDRTGATVHAYLTLPRGRPERGLPLIVLPHGGPFLRDSWQFDPEVQFLASLGYAVLQPNFRGSTGYGRDFVARGYGQYGAGMIDDIDDGVAWVTGQGIADPARVCIMGSSYGGYAAIWGAMRSPQRYRCAISFAGPTDLRGMLRYDSSLFIPRRYVRELQLQLQGEERIDLDAVAPVRHPEMLRVPLLIAHGEQDQIVPIDQSRRLLDALKRVHAPVESIFLPRSGHGFTDAGEAADFYREVQTFLAAHNPTPDNPAPVPTPAPATAAPVTTAPAAATPPVSH